MIFPYVLNKSKQITALLASKYLNKHNFLRLRSEGPYYEVKQKILNGQIAADHKQSGVIQALQQVYENIQGYSPKKLIISEPPKGLYIYGSVGTGKTMLMDIFYQSVKITSKRRSHFNNFMADVHSRVHELQKKKKTPSPKSGDKLKSWDPIEPVARQLVQEAWLLCFDEFQVTDIADAMILKRLFTEMFRSGMVMVATSNRAPEELYQNGLQRSNFLPFIGILKKNCDVIRITGRDYRTSNSDDINSRYLIIGERGTKNGLESAFKTLCNAENQKPKPKTFHNLGHKITFENTCGRVLYASFWELCGRPLGSADYIEIARNFDTILIKNVPKMTLDNKNQARRFILLIDTLYDKKIRIMLSAETEPHKLFSASGNGVLNNDQQRMMMDDLNIDSSSENGKASLFWGSEEIFAFERTVSRIVEMCSNGYWNKNRKR